MYHGLQTDQSSCTLGRLEEEEDDEIAVLPISRPDSVSRAVLATLGYFVDKRPLQKHSKLSKRP